MQILLLKISLAIFIAGNLLDLGLRLNLRDALGGLRNRGFVIHTLLWGFVLGPALAYAITTIVPLDQPYAIGLILLGTAPCAPFLPMIISRSRGDLGSTAAFMLLTAAGTTVFMPFAVPLLARGLTVSAWAIARPLLILILLPLAVGMAILRAWPAVAPRIQPAVRKITGVVTITTVVLCIIVYGKASLNVAGQLAVASQVVFFLIVSIGTYWFGFGLRHEQKIVLTVGMTTRNVGAAFAPLLAPGIDQRATVMVVLALPLMILFAWLATKWFGRAG